jgi:hypothetical protein
MDFRRRLFNFWFSENNCTRNRGSYLFLLSLLFAFVIPHTHIVPAKTLILNFVRTDINRASERH